MKVCSKCRRSLALDDFHQRAASKDGLMPRCKRCVVNYHRQYRKRPEFAAMKKRWDRRYANTAAAKAAMRNRRLKVAHGIDHERFLQLLKSQGGVCAICKASKAGGQGHFHVDHDHRTGRFRGLLCSNCNRGLGMFADDTARLRAAIRYLRRFYE